MTTDINGNAIAPTITANGTVGSYSAIVSFGEGQQSAQFALTNTAGPAASIVVASGSPQSGPLGFQFTEPLAVTVFDASNDPVANATVTFASPATGASATLTPTTAQTDALGRAETIATANLVSGGYSVTASATASPHQRVSR